MNDLKTYQIAPLLVKVLDYHDFEGFIGSIEYFLFNLVIYIANENFKNFIVVIIV